MGRSLACSRSHSWWVGEPGFRPGSVILVPRPLVGNKNNKCLRSRCNPSHMQSTWQITKLFVVRFPRVEMGTEISRVLSQWFSANTEVKNAKASGDVKQKRGQPMAHCSEALWWPGPLRRGSVLSSYTLVICNFTPQDTLLRAPSHLLPRPPRASCRHEIPTQFSKTQTRCSVPHPWAGSCLICVQAGRQRNTEIKAVCIRGLSQGTGFLHGLGGRTQQLSLTQRASCWF